MSLDIYLKCPCCNTELFAANYTHNVAPMWRKAGCYDALYESDGARTVDVILIFEEACECMEYDIDEYRKLNPENGWGNADEALAWLLKLRDACDAHPKAVISISK